MTRSSNMAESVPDRLARPDERGRMACFSSYINPVDATRATVGLTSVAAATGQPDTTLHGQLDAAGRDLVAILLPSARRRSSPGNGVLASTEADAELVAIFEL